MSEPNPTLDATGKPLPPSKCPECGYVMDAATVCDEKATDQDRPQPGDLSVCLKCAAILQFSETMILTAIQLEDIPCDDTKFQLRRIQQHIRMTKP